MRRPLLISCLTLLVGTTFVYAAENVATLNDLINEQMTTEKAFIAEYLQEAKESKYPEQATRYEEGLAAGYNEFMEYVKQSDDDEFKKLVLRLEFLSEARDFLYDKEEAKTASERAKAELRIQEYEAKLKLVK